MSDLKEYRQKTAEIDAKIAKLFEERLQLSAKAAEYKKEHGLSVSNPEEEDSVLRLNREFIEDPEIEEYYADFQKHMTRISNAYQTRLLCGMKVAYSGVEGAFAYIAAKRMFEGSQLVCKKDFRSAYRSVEKGECDCAVLPLENSYAGEVSKVLDLAFSGELFVNQVLDLPVEHCLLGVPGSRTDQIRTVVSHPQALMQCAEYIERHGFESKEYGNTALASRMVKETNDPAIAAIASKESAELMGLSVLEEKIQDSGINTTRFAVFSKASRLQAPSSGRNDEVFILVFTVKDEAGALARTLNIIGAHGYNMRSLRSRPMKELLWNYYFFMEVEGNVNTQNGKDMLREMSAFCDRLKLVGTYHTSNLR